jgi:hypothetical protein
VSCLGRLFGLLGLLVLAALGYEAWIHRDELDRMIRFWRGTPANEAPAATGVPTLKALRSATDKVDSLNGWRADSVVVTAQEMASLIGDGLDQRIRGHVDSLSVTLGAGVITVRARMETRQIPRDALGPLAGALQPWERVQASGPVRIVRPGTAEWEVESLRLRDFAFPREVIRGFLARAVRDASPGTVPVRIPRGITAVRVSSQAVILYGAPANR